jgi:2-polyprenyl-3-methyl-5-hydroxy-6-metoxy-1,4-benzoquinol methylase
MCAADFNDYSTNYRDLLRKSLGSFSSNVDYFDSHKIACIRKWVTNGDHEFSILDFGCGEGRLTGLMARTFTRAIIYGYDVAEKLLEQARLANQALGNLHFDSAFPSDARFDLIVAANVFHHIHVQNRANVLLRLKRILNGSGRIIIFEHNPLNPVTRHVVKSCPFDEDAVLIHSRSFALLAETCGLKVIRRNYILFFPWPSAFLEKMEGILRHVPLGGQYMMELAIEAP